MSEREDLTFPSGEDTCAAWLYRPAGVAGPVPCIVMAHGFTDDKTIWEETGRSDRVISQFRPATNSHWNNIWFVTRGYAVLNYTARGWHDSCGPDTPNATKATPAPQCASHQYWIHLDDKRWEVRDAQVSTWELDPATHGLAIADAAALRGGEPAANAARIERLLSSDGGASGDESGRAAVLLNAGAALYVAGIAASYEDGLARARSAIAAGRAHAALERLRRAATARTSG